MSSVAEVFNGYLTIFFFLGIGGMLLSMLIAGIKYLKNVDRSSDIKDIILANEILTKGIVGVLIMFTVIFAYRIVWPNLHIQKSDQGESESLNNLDPSIRSQISCFIILSDKESKSEYVENCEDIEKLKEIKAEQDKDWFVGMLKDWIRYGVGGTIEGIWGGIGAMADSTDKSSSSSQEAGDAESPTKYDNVVKLINGTVLTEFLYTLKTDTPLQYAFYFKLVATIQNLAIGILSLLVFARVLTDYSFAFLKPGKEIFRASDEMGFVIKCILLMILVASNTFIFTTLLRFEQEVLQNFLFQVEINNLIKHYITEVITFIIHNFLTFSNLTFVSLLVGTGLVGILLFGVVMLIINNFLREIALLILFPLTPIFIVFSIFPLTQRFTRMYFFNFGIYLFERIVRTIILGIGLSVLTINFNIYQLVGSVLIMIAAARSRNLLRQLITLTHRQSVGLGGV